ncbi:antigen WC1.1-like isoform X6 [Apostichopus japonicus]|uniref:antigen WC1.1-like isoform X6 n=1 Tax=Stichopus japonicus TaxID=307972 RepID=UPI003AB66A6C
MNLDEQAHAVCSLASHIVLVILLYQLHIIDGSQTGDVRLVGGSTPNEGRVEIFYNDTWGTVCDDAWGDNDASVVCRQLGMGSHALATCCANFGVGFGTIWMDNVDCSGSEASLSHCTALGWGAHNCDHIEDAGVVCQDVRLVGGSTPNEGRVEVYYNGIWGTVCDDNWDDVNAWVVCRQLGMGNHGKATYSAFFGEGVGTIWMDRVGCAGDEVSLTECASRGWGVHSCGHHEDAGVYCQDANWCTIGSCLNGGTCVNHPDGTRCICDLGYYGDNCQYDANVCTYGSCLNGGTCVNQPNGTKCICDLGYYGDNCEYENTLTCKFRVCDNGATCVDQPDGIKCICPVGYHGNYCEYAPIEKNWVNVLGIISMVLCSVLIIAVAYLMYELKWKQRKTPPAPTPSTMDTSGVHHSSAKPTNQVRYDVGSDNPAISAGEDSIYEIKDGIYENSDN